MTVTVRLFARARDLAGADRIEVELPAGATVATLRGAVAEKCPALMTILERCAVAVDNDFATANTALHPSAEVALLPPVSGG